MIHKKSEKRTNPKMLKREVPKRMLKRSNYLNWDAYFMGLALLSSQRSKDPRTQVGACIVKNNRILSMGYNGFPNGCSDDEFPWNSDGDVLNVKNTFVCHAELNAILNSSGDVRGATIYVTFFPCNECTKAIIQSGIKKVVYLDDRNHNKPCIIASRKMMKAAGVNFVAYQKQNKTITIDL